jgi:hypothetical protein
MPEDERYDAIISIDQKHKTFYDGLKKTSSPLRNLENSQIWLLAFGLGFHNKLRSKNVQRAGGGYFRTVYFHDFIPFALLRAACVDDNGGDLTKAVDWSTIFSTAEEYAIGGTQALKELIESHGDFYKKLEDILRDEYKKKVKKK